MKKLVLFFATVVAVAFASCGPKAVEGGEVVDDSTIIDVPAVDSTVIVVDSTTIVVDTTAVVK